MPGVTPALDFLAAATPAVPAVCVIFGDDAFLKSEVLAVVRQAVLGDADGEFSQTEFIGDDVAPREVFDCLTTVALFGAGRRLIVVREADGFVSSHRATLGSFVAKPSSAGALVLDVGSWPSNTKLAKAIVAGGLTIECKTPAPQAILKWLVARAKAKHGANLERAAAELLLDTLEPELGLLDQELAKLALSAGANGTIEPALVREMVGGWRTKTTWDMLDMAVAGNADEALRELDRLLASGESPVAILAQVASTLRRFAATTRGVERAERAGRRMSLRQALEAAGFKPFVLTKAEAQLRQLGRERSGKLYRQALDADLALKGSSSAPARARIVLEQLIARMSSVAAPV